MDKTSHVLLSLDFQKTKYSGVLFNDKYILTSSKILSPIILNTESENVKKSLKNFHLIKFDKMNPLSDKANISVIHNKLENTKTVDEKKLFKSKAKLLYLFNCQNISDEFERIFREFIVENSVKNNLDDELNNLLISSFVLLTFDKNVPQENVLLSELNVNCLTINKNGLKYKPNKIKKLDEIVLITTPFCHESFFGTINVGRVANIFGKNDALILVSCPITKGCDGSAIYNMKSDLIGIIICSTLYSGNDNFEFTLVANFNEIFLQISKQLGISNNIIEDNISSKKDVNSSVLIKGKGSLGSGSFIRIKDKRFIITCSHVVQNNSNIVDCVYSEGSFTTKIIFRNPNYGAPYDIAILEAPKFVPEEYFVECARQQPQIGQLLYSIAFPIFTNFNSRKLISSIYEGRVTKYSKGVLFTDICIQAGQSGGGIFDEEGLLFAISVLNVRYPKGIITPRINMAVPIFDILNCLEDFVLKNDKNILDQLIMAKSTSISKKWFLEAPKILSKL